MQIFDLMSKQKILELEGHTEEVLDLKKIQIGGENYIISAGQDGVIYKWHLNHDFSYVGYSIAS